MADYPKDYSEELCTTAGELRRHGLPLPGIIPNDAWVPDKALDMGETWSTDESGGDKQLVSLVLATPFQLGNYTYPVTAVGVITKTKIENSDG